MDLDEEDDILTITELNIIIKSSLKEILPNSFKISGELFNCKKNGGNMYATVRDSNSSLSLIQWKAPQIYSNGDSVIIHGHIEYYSKNSNINFIAKQIEIVGNGIIYQIYNDIKLKYETKGYFDIKHKKSFPQQLNKIALITSINGAALHDILYVLTNGKFPGLILVKNCLVQGIDCAKSVSDAISFLNKSYPDIDLLMITRGGGSLEDLMGFSDPLILEAIYKSKIYSMSAIGHQIDSMLSDYVADISAPTPSIGAEVLLKSTYNVANKILLLKSKQNTINDVILARLKNIKKTRYNIIYLYQQNKIKYLQNKMNIIIQSKLLCLKTSSEKLKLQLDSYKKSQYNCKMILNNNIVKTITDIKNGIYTLIMHDVKSNSDLQINIEIKILS